MATALRVADTLGRKTVRWALDDDMDQRLGASRDTGDARADAQLCNLVLSKVDPDLVEVFVLYELEGLTSPEIAAQLEIPLWAMAISFISIFSTYRATKERAVLRAGRAEQARGGVAPVAPRDLRATHALLVRLDAGVGPLSREGEGEEEGRTRGPPPPSPRRSK